MVGIGDEFEKLYKDCHAAGGMSRFAYEDDPKRAAFTAARYKHTAKLLSGYKSVLEIGCADGYYSRIVRQHVDMLMAIDVDADSINEAVLNNSKKWPIIFVHSTPKHIASLHSFNAIYCLDVLEHIEPGVEEHAFLSTMADIAPVAVIGTPSLESQTYASALSQEGHINCQSGEQLRLTLKQHWSHVFMFSMNDEAIGTGFLPMAHYLLALCVK